MLDVGVVALGVAGDLERLRWEREAGETRVPRERERLRERGPPTALAPAPIKELRRFIDDATKEERRVLAIFCRSSWACP